MCVILVNTYETITLTIATVLLLIFEMDAISAKAKQFGVPLEILNEEHITVCKSIQQLENILKVLRADGNAPLQRLVRLAEEKLATLCPDHFLLKTSKGVIHPPQLEPGSFNSLLEEIEGWKNQMLESQEKLNEDVAFVEHDREEKEVSTLMTTLERLDVIGERPKSAFLLHNMGRKNLVAKNAPIGNWSSEEKRILSLREKQKGNECFKAEDFKEAIRYFSNSIAISPNPEAFNNRGMAYLKEGAFLHCVSDCGKVLQHEPNNIKALLRCGFAHAKLGNRELATDAYSKVLQLEPTNKAAKKEIDNLEHLKLNLIIPESGSKKLSKTRPLIEEI
ncbi:sperm-associated antigen 1 [Cloeon dipterum]|uniref:sperm-associated antigen 1 n=1 Tax=Cloeon dipterum TaxID=197152 RepID=UPI00322036EC